MRLKRLSRLPETNVTRRTFGGLNRTARVGEGEWSEMQNLTSDRYPVLSTRARRGRAASAAAFGGFFRYDNLCFVDGSAVVVNGYRVEMGLSDTRPKQIARMGAYAIILPDKKYLNLADLTDHGEIEARVSITGTVRIAPSDADGNTFSSLYTSATSPTDTTLTWLDTSGETPVLRRYSAATADWSAQLTSHLRISATGIGKPFSAGDGVRFSGFSDELDGTHVITARGDGFVVITGLMTATTSLTGATLSRVMPDMDFITEAGNRLWGCRYGVGADGGTVNELYASALGDFRNWECYGGLSTDSFAVGVGSDGAFTGACTYLGTPVFFKENHMHRVTGGYPATFAVSSTPCRGVKTGCAASLAMVDETLFYLATGGVCAYDGSLPVLVSEALGTDRHERGAAGALDGKYYLSAYNKSRNGWEMLVLDTKRGLWHREDATHATAFLACDGELYFATGTGEILTVRGTGATAEGKLPYRAVSGVIGLDDPCHRYLSRLHLRVALGEGASLCVMAQYDSQGEYEELFSTRSEAFRGFTAVLRPRRCDHLRLFIEGEGEMLLYSLTRTEEKGGA